ncbi:MAG: helix-turn-helix transcriptional regulator [Pseudomonadota bacterium]
MNENGPYNDGHRTLLWSKTPMSKRKNQELTDFGARMAELRKSAGYTQVELAEELGVTQRMIAYYEGQTDHPPTALLPGIARALRISVDELLGTKALPKTRKPRNTRLHRRLEQIEQLGAKEKRQVVQFLDTFIEREKLKKKAATG